MIFPSAKQIDFEADFLKRGNGSIERLEMSHLVRAGINERMKNLIALGADLDPPAGSQNVAFYDVLRHIPHFEIALCISHRVEHFSHLVLVDGRIVSTVFFSVNTFLHFAAARAKPCDLTLFA